MDEEMELRDLFAGMAMHGLMVRGDGTDEGVSRLAYRMADIMMEARDEDMDGIVTGKQIP